MQESAGRGRWRRRKMMYAGVGLAAGGLALVTGCQAVGSDQEPAAGRTDKSAAAVPKVAAMPANATVYPAGKRLVRPDEAVLVKASSGKLQQVVVKDAQGRVVPGVRGGAGTTWVANGRLDYGTRYDVTTSAANADGKVTRVTSSFKTITPNQTVGFDRVTPDDGDVVGVGMPIIVDFDADVVNKAAVERALKVTSSRPVFGSWSWVDDDEVHYRLPQYWPAYTDVTVSLALRGVEVSPGEWGEEDRELRFRIGPSMVSKVDGRSLRMRVVRDGKLVRTIPVTTGRSGYTTRSGIKVISERNRIEVMEAPGLRPGHPEYYRLTVAYAMRITNTGEFVHAAPWSVGSQGRRRVSHGCVGMSTSNARWFYQNTLVGDIVQVVNTGRGLESQNGWTDWNVPWEEWRAGSAV